MESVLKKRRDDPFVTVGLRETYHENGEFSFKIVVDRDELRRLKDVSMRMFDPDGAEMPVDVRRWGKKVSCEFSIVDSTPSGVAVVDIEFTADDGKKVNRMLSYWVIK